MQIDLKIWESVLSSHIDALDYFNKNIVGVLKKDTRELNSSRMATICPFPSHEDTDPSFHYWKSRKIFHCFGCGFTGGILALHLRAMRAKEKSNISLEDALKNLLSLYNLSFLYHEEKTNKNFFELGREKIDITKLVYQPNTFSLAYFRQQNNRITNGSWDLTDKLDGYAELDIRAGLSISQGNSI